MNPATITALVTGITGLVAAVSGLVALFRHTQNPNAHTPPSK